MSNQIFISPPSSGGQTTALSAQKRWLDMTFAEHIARRLGQIIGAGSREERAMSDYYLQELLWRTRYDWARRRDGKYRTSPAGLHKLLQDAYNAGLQARETNHV